MATFLFLQLICCVTAFPQGNGQLVKTEYDANKNVTQITLNPIILASRKFEELRLGAVTGYPGKVKSTPQEIALIFFSLSNNDQNRYESARKLTIVADDQRFDCGETQRSKQSQNGLFLETMTISIPVKDFVNVANAKQVKIKLGLTEVELSPVQSKALKVMASYIVDN
ncbi:MAG: hypothetical protein C5B55_05315 [Blastocatellia bacterium]|nr:MAG: hypothetical protein C5B55_05315 [Blastocatellia bacterium]